MTKNKKGWKQSGRDTHKFLMKESFRFLKNQGFNVELEHSVGEGIIDVLGIKGKEKIGIECSVRPTLSFVKMKHKLYSKDLDKLIFAYPSNYKPNFPINEFGEVLEIMLPEFLKEKSFIEDNKLSEGIERKLTEVRKKYPNKIIGVVTISKEGQRRITIPKEDKTLKDGDYVEVIKIEWKQ